MALEDIEKLKERLEKNPDSKLFVPLAEEYRKAEMFDEAIEVLKQGLELQPNYMSARVALGKIYLEKEMLDEARAEFEKVVKAIPDNLFAHKKLAEIYKETGNVEKALMEYETILKLNPLDEDAQINIETLSSGEAPSPPGRDAMPPPAMKGEAVSSFPDDVAEQVPQKESGAVAEEPAVAEEVEGEAQEAAPLPEEEVQTVEATEPVGTVGTVETAGTAGTTGTVEPAESAYPLPADEQPAEAETEDDAIELGADFEAFKSALESDARPLPPGAEDTLKESPMFASADEDFQPAPGTEIPSDEKGHFSLPDDNSTDSAAPVEGSDILKELRYAEELVGQERYHDAVRYYNDLMTKYPENRNIKQKLQELKAYLKIIGRDREELINRLEMLLHGFMQRKK